MPMYDNTTLTERGGVEANFLIEKKVTFLIWQAYNSMGKLS